MNPKRSNVSPAGVFLLVLAVMVHVEAALGQQVAWTRLFGSVGQPGIATSDTAVSLAVAASGHIYVAGDVSGTLPDQGGGIVGGGYVRKYNSNGTKLWTRQFDAEVNSVSVDGSGNIYVAGIAYRTLPGQSGAGREDAYVRKYDANGNQIWTRQFGTKRPDAAAAVAAGNNGSVYVVGYTFGAFPGQSNAGPGYGDAFLRKFDTSGNHLWPVSLVANTTMVSQP
jgi:outer membrane protein assembly factor BamB